MILVGLPLGRLACRFKARLAELAEAENRSITSFLEWPCFRLHLAARVLVSLHA